MISNEYSGKVKHYFSSERAEMIPFIPIGVRTLLEVGCGTGAFASNLKTLYNVEVTAIEPHQSSSEMASKALDRVLNLDVEAGISALQGSKFDCIVFNDVLEHLTDPWDILKKVRGLVSPGGKVVVSLPNIRYMPVFKEFVIDGNWRYQRDGVMDKTHLRFFTKKTIQEMFVSSGYVITAMQGINRIEFPWKYSLINTLTRGRLEDTRYQQYACVATPDGA